MANNVKRIIREEGIVLEKIFKKATNEFKGQDGRVVDAKPDRYVVKVASSQLCDQELGLTECSVLDYEIELSLYNKIKYMNAVNVAYELTPYRTIPMSLTIKENKKVAN